MTLRLEEPDLAYFAQMTEADTEAWFRTGLEQLFVDNAGTAGFSPFDAFLSSRTSIEEDFKAIFFQLPSSEKEKFRNAFLNVFEGTLATETYAPILLFLVRLAILVGEPRILSSAITKLRAFLSRREDKDFSLDIYSALFVLVDKQPGKLEARLRLLDQLVGSPYFDTGTYSGLALLNYCKLKPEKFLSHLRKFRAGVGEQLDKGMSDFAQKDLAIRILDAAGPAVIAKSLNQLEMDEYIFPNDRWFFDGIVDRLSPDQNNTYVNSAGGLAFKVTRKTFRISIRAIIGRRIRVSYIVAASAEALRSSIDKSLNMVAYLRHDNK